MAQVDVINSCLETSGGEVWSESEPRKDSYFFSLVMFTILELW